MDEEGGNEQAKKKRLDMPTYFVVHHVCHATNLTGMFGVTEVVDMRPFRRRVETEQNSAKLGMLCTGRFNLKN